MNSTFRRSIGGSLPSSSYLHYRVHRYRYLLPRHLIHGELDRLLRPESVLGFTRCSHHSFSYQHDW